MAKNEQRADKRTSVRGERVETLLIRRAYQAHPGQYANILETMKEKLNILPKEFSPCMKINRRKKIQQRIREKVQRLIMKRETIKDDEIRHEIEAVLKLNRKGATSITPSAMTRAGASCSPTPSVRRLPSQTRSPILSGSGACRKPPSACAQRIAYDSISEEEDEVDDIKEEWKVGERKRKERKDFIMENEKMKNRLLKHILRSESISSTSSSD